ncbi:MAG: chorismate mutase, partial [Marinobacter nauticus]|nr:chorismate mutase [Marinobacter nauticus]
MTDEKTRLGELREEIDALDQQIMELISARAKCAQEV